MAGTACDILNDDIVIDCDTKPVGGAEALIHLIPKADFDEATKAFDSTNKLILNSLALATGKKAYQLLVFRRGHKPRFTNKDTDYGTYYLHEIVTAIQIWNNDVKAQIPGLSDSYYVAIVENVQKSGDAVFEVYGATNGLRVQDGALRDLGANEGVYTMTLGNDSNMYEPKPPLSFVVTAGSPAAFSYAATKAAIVALETPAT